MDLQDDDVRNLVPREVLLDVLKFMDYQEYCKIEMAARIFHSLIDRYSDELALAKFYQLQILPEHAVSLKTYRRATEITEAPYVNEDDIAKDLLSIEDDEKEGWKKLIEDHTPLYSYPDLTLVSQLQHDEIDSFLLFITKEDNESPQKLCLELPLYADTEEDLLFTRFWLLQLGRACFQWMDCGRFFFNPEVVDILCPASSKLRGIKFHSRRMDLKIGIPDELHNRRFLQFASNSVVTECLTLRCGTYFEGVLDLILRAGPRIEKIIIPSGPYHATVELQNMIIYNAESKLNPLQMVGNIEFQNVNDFPWPYMRSAKCVGMDEDHILDYKKYAMSNLHCPKVRFSISIGHLHGSMEFKRFSIERTIKEEREN